MGQCREHVQHDRRGEPITSINGRTVSIVFARRVPKRKTYTHSNDNEISERECVETVA